MKNSKHLLFGILLLSASVFGAQEQPSSGLPLNQDEKLLVADVVNDIGGLVMVQLLHEFVRMAKDTKEIDLVTGRTTYRLSGIPWGRIEKPIVIFKGMVMAMLVFSCYKLKEALRKNALREK